MLDINTQNLWHIYVIIIFFHLENKFTEIHKKLNLNKEEEESTGNQLGVNKTLISKFCIFT